MRSACPAWWSRGCDRPTVWAQAVLDFSHGNIRHPAHRHRTWECVGWGDSCFLASVLDQGLLRRTVVALSRGPLSREVHPGLTFRGLLASSQARPLSLPGLPVGLHPCPPDLAGPGPAHPTGKSQEVGPTLRAVAAPPEADLRASRLQKRREELVLHVQGPELLSLVELILSEAETRSQDGDGAARTLIQTRLPLLLSCCRSNDESIGRVTEHLTSCIQQWGDRYLSPHRVPLLWMTAVT